MSGVFSTGKSGIDIIPISTITIEITAAKIGRFMKNSLNIKKLKVTKVKNV